MNEIGTYEQSFEMLFQGLSLPTVLETDVPDHNLRVSFAPSTKGTVKMTVELRNTGQEAGRTLARRFADKLFNAFSLEFAHYITQAVAPRPNNPSFTVQTASGVETVFKESSDTLSISIGPGGGSSNHVFAPEPTRIKTVIEEVGFCLTTLELPTSAALYSARNMFSIAMQSDDSIARFLILYSATALAALFKWSDGKQTNVDKLLQDANPSLSLASSGRNGGKETIYTKIRNDFVHSEERAPDPSNTIREIQKYLPDFQRDVAAVLKML